MQNSPGVFLVEHPIAQTILAQMRDKATSPAQFRALLKQLSMFLFIEAARDFETCPKRVSTPLAECEGRVLHRPVAFVPILRAGLGMLEGMLAILPHAPVGHIGMKRDPHTHLPTLYYCNLPPGIADAEVLLLDPMLATGHSASGAITELKQAGVRRIRFLCAVSCPEGLSHLRGEHPDVPVYTASVDQGLDVNAYILPGLGDAGDRCFGTTE